MEFTDRDPYILSEATDFTSPIEDWSAAANGADPPPDYTDGSYIDTSLVAADSTRYEGHPELDTESVPLTQNDAPNDIPPTEPPTPAETAEPDPSERGTALQRLLDYGTIIDDTVMTPLADLALTDTDLMEGLGFSLDVDADLAKETGMPLPDTTAIYQSYRNAVRQRATAAQTHYNADPDRYAAELAATGLQSDPDGSLLLADPIAFAAALEQLQLPAGGLEEHVQEQLSTIVDFALVGVQGAFLPDYSPLPSPERIAYVTAVTANAEMLAQRLEAVGIDPTVANPMRQLGLAAAANVLPLWAEAYELEIIGSDNEAIGTGRLVHPDQWEPAIEYLGRLHHASPGSAFTQSVWENLLTSIEATIAEYEPTLEYGQALIEEPRYIIDTLRTARAKMERIRPSQNT